jgi:predicted transcriptional regulator
MSKEVNLTDNRKLIIKALANGVQLSWKELRLAYFGPERAAHPASTSFMTQINKMTELGLIQKVEGKYSLADAGQLILTEHPEILEGNFVSTAARTFDPSKVKVKAPKASAPVVA